MYILDRLEGGYAVIEHTDENGTAVMLRVDSSSFSDNIREGDVLVYKNGVFITDKDKTDQQRQRILEINKKLIK